MNLCEYKDLFGSLKTGIHSYRFMDVAYMDFLVTMIIAYIISYFTKKNFIYCFIFLFILGIFLHRLFCVRTTIDKFLFPNVKTD